jgi:hypothetical protein
MEAQRSSSGFEHNAWTQDGTEVKGIPILFSWGNSERHANFKKMMVVLKSTSIPKSAERSQS